jgi:hypothetical protein
MTFKINDNFLVQHYQKPGRVGLTGGAFTNDVDIRYDNYIFADEHCPLSVKTSFNFVGDNIFTSERPYVESILFGSDN